MRTANRLSLFAALPSLLFLAACSNNNKLAAPAKPAELSKEAKAVVAKMDERIALLAKSHEVSNALWQWRINEATNLTEPKERDSWRIAELEELQKETDRLAKEQWELEMRKLEFILQESRRR